MDDTPTPIAEIDHGPSKFDIFLEENQKLLIGGAVVIFLGVLGYVGYTSFAEMKAAEAGEALAAAEQSADIQQVISQHSTSASAGSAALLLANEKALESNQAAIDALRDFISNYPNHPALATATTNLGLRLLNEGKLDEAQAQLSSVEDIANSEYIAPVAKIGLGDIAKAKGDTELAKQNYNEVINLVADAAGTGDTIGTVNKFAGYTQIANTRLRLLTAEAPKEVEKKTTPEPSIAPTSPEVTEAEAPTSKEAAPEKKQRKAKARKAKAKKSATPEADLQENTLSEEKDEKNSQASE
ncbi:tetratricopeptide repeat protein [Rubritalea spongiae]|uniref:Tetratricopeptide repeat protein n=1 Tax=Rubritalea spongiae TaxID=430797 RepID=A0ABW5E2Y8_9BACT